MTFMINIIMLCEHQITWSIVTKLNHTSYTVWIFWRCNFISNQSVKVAKHPILPIITMLARQQHWWRHMWRQVAIIGQKPEQCLTFCPRIYQTDHWSLPNIVTHPVNTVHTSHNLLDGDNHHLDSRDHSRHTATTQPTMVITRTMGVIKVIKMITAACNSRQLKD